MIDNTCKETCPSDISSDLGDGFCRPCDLNCKTCNNFNTTICSSCPINTVLSLDF